MKILVTGAAGFIGSHLVDYLIKEHHVIGIDNLSLGREENLCHNKGNKNFRFIKLEITDKNRLNLLFRRYKFDCVFHFAANSDIQKGSEFHNIDLENTFMTTFNVLECMKENNVREIVFASSSAIYGELNSKLYEDIGPLFPISFYGAAKLSSEAYISAFSEHYDIKSWIIRFPNVVGDRLTHGAIYDFIRNLKENPNELVILGDGKQKKPYLHVSELINAIIFVWKNSHQKINYFNIGVDNVTSVKRIADIVVNEMNIRNVKFRYTGGDRGWVGDVPIFKYDLTKVHNLGWKAKFTSDEAIRLAVKNSINKR